MITATLDRFCTLKYLPEHIARTIMARLTMSNPVYEENEKRGRWNGTLILSLRSTT